MEEVAGDSVLTPFAGVRRADAETPCISVVFWKRHAVQCTMLERFPKLDVAGSSPVSRSIFNNLQAIPDVLCPFLLHNSHPACTGEERRSNEVEQPEVRTDSPSLRPGWM